MTAPYETGAAVPNFATCFSVEQLRAEAGRGPVSNRLCQELRDNHFVIVKLDDDGRSAMKGLWAAARNFFDLSAEQKEAVAG
jgi:isopenicillin N synthase-like dioxygenase